MLAERVAWLLAEMLGERREWEQEEVLGEMLGERGMRTQKERGAWML